jgi:hypothetical protein
MALGSSAQAQQVITIGPKGLLNVVDPDGRGEQLRYPPKTTQYYHCQQVLYEIPVTIIFMVRIQGVSRMTVYWRQVQFLSHLKL